MKIKENKGVTLIALTVTIVVLLIISGIAIYSGKDTIKKANLEALRTNMLLIEAKARGLVEEANFQLGPNYQKESEIENIRTNVYENEENKLKKLSNAPEVVLPTELNELKNNSGVYVFTQETSSLWALNNVYGEPKEEGYYLIEFNEKEATVEIYNTLGYQGNYSLTQIDNLK